MKDKKVQKSIATGLILATSLSTAYPAMAGSPKFVLPVSESKIKLYSRLMLALGDAGVRSELLSDDSTPEHLVGIIRMLGDSLFLGQMKEIKQLAVRYTGGEKDLRVNLLEMNNALLGYLQENYEREVSILQSYYFAYLRDSGYFQQADGVARLSTRASVQASNSHQALQQEMVMHPTDAAVGANTIAYANLFVAGNVSIITTAVAITFLGVVAAIIGGPFFHYELS